MALPEVILIRDAGVAKMTETFSFRSVRFEVDPARLDLDEDIEVNQRNLMEMTQTVFDSIISSADRFPSQLRSMCHCLYQVNLSLIRLP